MSSIKPGKVIGVAGDAALIEGARKGLCQEMTLEQRDST